ncbi:hypothetical protein R1sor_025450 [Riccia sorocarpa]|uniref:SWIM-type domain-containing protein n=1 Tax=Riccia sorocarpa TaxID=122646 RepID=A0ABD3GBE5_9MARC
MAAEEAANWVVASIKPATAGSPPFSSLTDDQILMLHFLFNKTFDKAVRIIEQGGVYRLVAEPSGRMVFQVMGNPKEHQHYVCFPDHFCSCHAFFYDIVSRGHQLCCKHQLAARLASALQPLTLLQNMKKRQFAEKKTVRLKKDKGIEYRWFEENT